MRNPFKRKQIEPPPEPETPEVQRARILDMDYSDLVKWSNDYHSYIEEGIRKAQTGFHFSPGIGIYFTTEEKREKEFKKDMAALREWVEANGV